MFARERRQLRLFARRDTYGRYVSVLVYLPRDRYNTTVRERFAEILTRAARRRARRVHRPRQRVDHRAGPLRGPPAQGREHPRRRRRRPRAPDGPRPRARGATTSPPPSSRVRRGAGLAPGAAVGASRSPRPTRRTSPRIGPRPTSAGSRRSRATQGIDLALYEDAQVDAGRGEARLKVFRVGAPLSLSACCRCSPRWASRSSTSAPTSSRAWADSPTSTSSGCATAASSRPHARDPVRRRAPRGVGRPQRDRRLQRARARPPV